ncbi:MAG TPA: hypothetical protein ENF33_02860 [Nitrososphaeria archaeon]|nr:MAG: hypothetical protein DRN68_00205 [Nitrososphaerota archaeon]HDJ66638.1 hypothetical protein [Nitrososphaeria archaeon]
MVFAGRVVAISVTVVLSVTVVVTVDAPAVTVVSMTVAVPPACVIVEVRVSVPALLIDNLEIEYLPSEKAPKLSTIFFLLKRCSRHSYL